MPYGQGATAIIQPLPVTVQGGELRLLEGDPVAAVWSGPHGSYDKNNQVTTTNPGTVWSAGLGATASDDAKTAGTWTAAQKTTFQAEFPTARPGLLYGIVVVAWGSFMATIDDMYNASDTTTKAYRDREDWAYESNYFSLGKMFLPRSNQGMWDITFPKPIPFHLGLRVSSDNGSSSIYFLYSLDPDFP